MHHAARAGRLELMRGGRLENPEGASRRRAVQTGCTAEDSSAAAVLGKGGSGNPMLHETDKSRQRRICVIAGMPRAATTFLYHTLGKNPSVFVPARKELEFFSLNYERGSRWYLNFFKDMAAGQVGFDISPMYFMDDRSPQRMLEVNPDVKVILILRNPVEFVLSFYRNRLAATTGTLDFEGFLERHTYEKDGHVLTLEFKNGTISRNIDRFRQAFSNNLLLCDYRIIEEDPLPVLTAIESFLGIPRFFRHDNFENVRINASDQINLKFVNRLMHKKWFADLVTRLFPKRLIMFVRYKLQSYRPHRTQGITPGADEKKARSAQLQLAADVEYVSNLFPNAGLVLGSGQPYATAETRGLES